MRRALTLLVTLALPLLSAGLASADPLDDLARDVWAWRAVTRPSSGDDIPRLERPAGWRPDWSREAMAARRTALAGFTRRHQALDPASWPATRQVDYRLIGSALARVRWELDGAPAWRRDPAFYIQLVLSWAHENPIRRHYYDSGANEGLGFYAEEMMLQAAEYLEQTVPMDIATALEEAASFAAGPGQAITYQIGKLQVTSRLADRRRAQGGAFSLRAFHDYVWKNGNVPLSLLRWELLDDRRDIDRLRTLR